MTDEPSGTWRRLPHSLPHNHPSGDVTPSREDVTITRQLIAAGQLSTFAGRIINNG